MKGQKTNEQDKANVVAALAICDGVREAARVAGVPKSTVANIAKSIEGDPDYQAFRDKVRTGYRDEAYKLIYKVLGLMHDKVEQVATNPELLVTVRFTELVSMLNGLTENALRMEGTPPGFFGGMDSHDTIKRFDEW